MDRTVGENNWTNSSLGLPVYQNQSNLGSNEEVAEPSIDTFEDLGAPATQETPTIGVDPDSSPAKSKDAEGLSSVELILGLIGMFLLVTVLVWFLSDIGDRFERLQHRLSRFWRRTFRKNADNRSSLVEFPIASGELPPSALGTKKPKADLDEESSDSQESESHTAFLESDRRAANPKKKKIDDAIGEVHLLKQSLAELESQLVAASDTKADLDRETDQRIEIQAELAKEELEGALLSAREWETKAASLEKLTESLKQELADQSGELGKLQTALDQATAGASETTGFREDADTRYQKLTGELEESKLSQTQTQTELATAKEELQSLTSKTARVEQEMETAYQEMLSKGNVVTELESKVATFESLAQSLQEKLDLAETDLEAVSYTHLTLPTILLV